MFSNLLESAERLGLPLWDHQMHTLQWGAVLGASLVAAVWDVRTRRIPNALTLPMFGLGIAWAAWIGGIWGVAESLAGCVLAMTPFVLLFIFAHGGAGDAKLMGAIGAWLGIAGGILALFTVVVSGAIFGLLYAASKGQFGPVLYRIKELAWRWYLSIRYRLRVNPVELHESGQSETLVMPYGVSILSGVCLAALVVYLWHV